MTSAVASAIRPGLRENRQPASPHTPTRFISSTFSFPGSTFRQEEDAIIIELQPRGLKAGFEGESGPQCSLAFGPERSCRVGDYRVWALGYKSRPGTFRNGSKEHELWRNDLKDVDLGLLEDKLERTVREAYNKHLLTDAGTARLVLVLPSVIPHPVLSSILATLFERWNYASITLLPSPTMAAVAAGLRSAFVVEIGWEETIVTPIYEYRELSTTRSIRAMKTLTHQLEKILTKPREQNGKGKTVLLPVDFDFVEEVLESHVFCRPFNFSHDEDAVLSKRAGSLSLSSGGEGSTGENFSVRQIEMEWPSQSSLVTIGVPTSEISQSVETTFFNTSSTIQLFDDHERLLPQLVYQALLCLPPDVRATCMSRIVFVGAGAHIPGLTQRVLEEVNLLVKTHGWTAVRGKKIEEQRLKQADLAHGGIDPPTVRHDMPLPAGKDYVEERLQKQQAKEAQPHVHGVLREVKSLGPWAGASLLASLKIKGFVEVEREKFMSHGLSGAHRDVEISVVPQRMSSFGLAAARANERSSWTLGNWG